MYLEIFTIGLSVFVILAFALTKKIFSLRRDLHNMASGKQSLSVKYGKMSEQFFPFLKDYDHDPQEFRFLGTPIDGVQFEKDKIVFVEFKSGDSRLSSRQKEIQELIKNKKVEFKEIRINL